MTETVTLKGVATFVSTLDGAASAVKDLHDAADAAGRIVASLAATTAPRKSGRLASSVLPEVDASNVVVGSDLVYAPPIHNGWVAHNIAPNPFLATALDRLEPRVVAEYQKAVTAALGGVEGA